MKTGQTVKIYKDPYTQARLEGQARLVEHLATESWDEQHNMESWHVKFPGRDEPVVVRMILVEKD